jgi:hypothetical protein
MLIANMGQYIWGNVMKFGFYAAVLALAAPLPAAAKIIRVTYIGVVDGGIDSTGIFGPAESDLGGKRYRAVTVFDTSRGDLQTSPSSFAAIGGDRFGTTNPAISATLTINGVTESLTPDYFGLIYSSHAPGPEYPQFSFHAHQARHNSYDGVYLEDDFINNQIEVDAEMPGLPFGYDTSFHYLVQPGDYIAGSSFQILHCCAPEGVERYAYGSLAPQLLLVSVPEPASWTLLIAGFGLTGAELRRRRALPV